MMVKMREKSEVWFAVINIIAYVVLFSVADRMSEIVGVQKSITLPVGIILSVVIFMFVKKSNLMEYYGLCRGKYNLKKWLFFIPMIVIGTTNLWNGVTLNHGIMETVLYAVSMFFVGFLEEIIFRGYLFKAMCRNNVKTAVIVSSITFGMGHIINLLNGRAPLETFMQIIYATAIGFMLTVFFIKSDSIIPCIIFHGFFNASSIIGVQPEMTVNIISNIIVIVIAIAYSIYLFKTVFYKNEKNT